MPYIVMKRNDLPDGLLQQLDLKPNTSQRKVPYQPDGQTRYQRDILNETTTLTADVVDTECAGLIPWLLANVSSGAGVAATGSITTVVKANLLDGENVVITDGTTPTTFEIVVTAGYAPTPPRVPVDLSAAGVITADNVRDAFIAAINGVANFNITASSGGAATVTLTNTDENILAAARNVVITTTVADVGWAVAGMANATASDALTVAEATQDATDILGVLNYGAAGAAGALTFTAINAALTTGGITQAQLPDVLEILAGRTYTVPAGTILEAAGAFLQPGAATMFTADTRHTYLTSALRISLMEGRLALAIGATFTYGGTTGAALAVYNDDGSLMAAALP
jgi:hypothetical protein